MTSEFDPLHYTRQLEAAGVARNHAEVRASDMEERLTRRIETVRSEILGKLDLTRISLDAKIETMRLELDTKAQKLQVILEARLDRLEADIKPMKWVLGMQTGLMVAILMKLFIP